MNSHCKALGGKALLCAVLLLVLGVFPLRPALAQIQLIQNGGFETGDLTGWTVTDQTGGKGSFFVRSSGGMFDPHLLTAGPASGAFYAVSDQTDSGSHALTQTFTVPRPATSVVLSYDMFADNYDFFNFINGGPSTPPTLDFTIPDANQQARVDILSAGASPFDTGSGVLQTFYQGSDGDPADNPHAYTHYSIDITSLVGTGGTFQLRFAEVNNQDYLYQGIDNVSILEVPAPFVTTTSLSSAPSTSVFGQSVSFSASVTSAGVSVPEGTVTFTDTTAGVVLGAQPLSGGSAGLSTSALAVGGHAITASYSDTAALYAASSGNAIQTVNQAQTTATLAFTPASPDDTQPVKIAVTVSPVAPGAGTPTGSVTLTVNGVPQAVTLTGGTAFISAGPFAPGGVSVSAAYTGDGSFQASSSGAPQTVTVRSGPATHLSVTAPATAAIGIPFRVAIASLDARGFPAAGDNSPVTLTSTDPQAPALGTVTLTGGTGTATVTLKSAGPQTLTATENGGIKGQATVTVPKEASSTLLSVSTGSANFGQSVTFTAKVTGAGPSGPVAFSDGAAPIGTGTVSGGVATLMTATLSAGSHSITAAYQGDANNLGSSSNAVLVGVLPVLSAVSVSPASVTGGYPAAGTVTLNTPAAADTSVTLASGSASATVPATVVVKAGSSTATFAVTTKAVTAATPVTLTAACNGVSVTTTLTLTPVPALAGFTVSPNIVVGGTSATGTITLTAPASPGGFAVSLYSLPWGVVGLPATVTVPQGQTSATFALTTTPTPFLEGALLFASAGQQIGASYLIVTPVPKLVSVEVSARIKGGTVTDGTVTLSTLAATPVTVTLSSAGPASVPASVTIPAGRSEATFPVTSTAVGKDTKGAISASYGGASVSATVTVSR